MDDARRARCESPDGIARGRAEPDRRRDDAELRHWTASTARTSEHGNVLWDCTALVDDDAKQRIQDLGGIDVIAMSHPHFYAAHVDIADEFNARVLIPRADEQWIQRPSNRIELFEDFVEVTPDITLARIGGHFDGAAVLHWAAGSEGRGALLTGDT